MSVSRDRKIKAIIKTYLPDPNEFLSLYNGLKVTDEEEVFARTKIDRRTISHVEWFYYIFRILEDYIDKSYLTNEDKEIINNIFPIISIIYSYGEYEKLDLSMELLSLHHLLNKKLEKLTDTNYLDFKDLQNKISELAIANKYDLMHLYDGSSYYVIKHILFEEKDKEKSLDLLDEYPSIASISIDGESLFNMVIDNYLHTLKGTVKDNYKNTKEYEYYSEIISAFLNDQELHISSKNKKELLAKINNYKEMLSTNESCRKQRMIDDEVDELVSRIELLSDIDIKNLIKKFDIDMDFDPIINQEYYSLRRPEDMVDSFEHEVLSNTCVISIDYEESWILDDALSIERDKNGNFILGIHIADPTNYVIPGGLIDNKARERAFSLLFGKPMFPKGLLKNYLTLKEGVPRYAFSSFYTIDKDGNIIDEEYKKTLLMVNKNLTVEEANNIIENGAKNEYLDNTLRDLNECTNRLYRSIKFNPSYEQEKGKRADITNTRMEGKDMASSIVRYAMALPNHRIATIAHENKYPFIYRNFIPGGDGLGEYSTTSRGHAGLGFADYGHITSPLNRYGDYANLVALNTWLFREPTKEELYDLDSELKYIAYSINGKQRKYKNLVKSYYNKIKEE